MKKLLILVLILSLCTNSCFSLSKMTVDERVTYKSTLIAPDLIQSIKQTENLEFDSLSDIDSSKVNLIFKLQYSYSPVETKEISISRAGDRRADTFFQSLYQVPLLLPFAITFVLALTSHTDIEDILSNGISWTLASLTVMLATPFFIPSGDAKPVWLDIWQGFSIIYAIYFVVFIADEFLSNTLAKDLSFDINEKEIRESSISPFYFSENTFNKIKNMNSMDSIQLKYLKNFVLFRSFECREDLEKLLKPNDEINSIFKGEFRNVKFTPQEINSILDYCEKYPHETLISNQPVTLTCGNKTIKLETDANGIAQFNISDFHGCNTDSLQGVIYFNDKKYEFELARN